MTTDTKPLDPTILDGAIADDAPPAELAPIAVPATLDQLAARKRDAAAIINARVEVLATVRTWALRALWPQDLVLFKSDDGLVIAYLEDAGCDRVRPYFGIEIRDVSTPERIAGSDPGAYYYIVRASGVCKLTGELLEQVEGGRSSAEEFVKHVADPLQRDLYVRRAARASVDGIVVRTLAGLQSIPIEELRAAWAGTTKSVDLCRKGRGFGSKTERLGGARENEPNVAAPVCPYCKTPGKYRPARGDRGAFYGCPRYAEHADQKWIVDAAEWVAKQTAAAPPAAAAPAPATGAPLTADEVFGRGSRQQPATGGER